MRHRPRLVGALAVLTLTLSATALAALAGAMMALPAMSAEPTTSVRIAVSNLRNDHGMVQACLTTRPDHFPDCRDDPASHRLSMQAHDGLVLRFDQVQPGTYAVALLHDENSNGRADRVLSMIPREGFGFSRDAPVRMGPPGFDQAAFDVGAEPVRQTIRMRYLL